MWHTSWSTDLLPNPLSAHPLPDRHFLNTLSQGLILYHFRYGRPVPIISPPGDVRVRFTRLRKEYEHNTGNTPTFPATRELPFRRVDYMPSSGPGEGL